MSDHSPDGSVAEPEDGVPRSVSSSALPPAKLLQGKLLASINLIPDADKKDPGSFDGHVDGKTSVFAQKILRHVESSNKQVELGQYWLRRFRNVTKKLSELEENYSKEIIKAVDHEALKFDKYDADSMPGAWKVYLETQNSLKKIANSHQKHSSEMFSYVAKPSKHFVLDSEIKRKKIFAKAELVTKNYLAAREKAKKMQMKCIAAYETNKAHLSSPSPAAIHTGTRLPAASVAASKLDKPEKSEKKRSMSDVDDFSAAASLASPTAQSSGGKKGLFAALTDKVVGGIKVKDKKLVSRGSILTTKEDATRLDALTQEYVQVVDQANDLGDKYFKDELPEIQASFEACERARLQFFQIQFNSLADSYKTLAKECAAAADDIAKKISEMNVDADIASFVDKVLQEEGHVGPDDRLDYDLPYESPYLPARKSPNDVSPDGIFRISLPEIMSAEKKVDSTLEIPRIVDYLIGLVKQNDGFKTEGIFRISAGSENLANLRKQIDQGIYDAKLDIDPHTPAALLKEWLRGLPEPLIPFAQYETCIGLAKSEVIKPKNYLEIVDKLPAASRNIIYRICQLLRELSLPENVESSKMSLKNLAIVFAPSLLRSEKRDPVLLLKNSNYELLFVARLVEYLPATYDPSNLEKAELAVDIEASRSSKLSLDDITVPLGGGASGSVAGVSADLGSSVLMSGEVGSEGESAVATGSSGIILKLDKIEDTADTEAVGESRGELDTPMSAGDEEAGPKEEAKESVH